MLGRLQGLFKRESAADASPLTPELRPLRGRVRLPWDGGPAQLRVGDRELRLYPDTGLGAQRRGGPRDWILLDPEHYFSEIAGFARIAAGETLLLGRENEHCDQIFGFSRTVRRRHVHIENRRGELIVAPLDPEASTEISLLDDQREASKFLTQRLENLDRVCELFGGPLELLSPGEALASVARVNALLSGEGYRRPNADGRPGGLLDLPNRPTPVIIGDLHARVDNLLKVLSENCLLESLERGTAYLLFLGDAVHSEEDSELAEMDSSLLMLDLIFKLKIEFPNSVFYLRGNHDSFDEAVAKGGVCQGVLLRQRALELRGHEYVDELTRFFEHLPYVAKTKRFIACHAAPTRSEVPMQMLVDIQKYPGVAHEITWNRLKRPNRPAGYTKGSVKRFRSSLGVAKHTPFIVGHSHITPEGTVWTDVGGIRQHHVLTCSNLHNLAIFVRLNGEMTPLEYLAEPLLALANERAASGDVSDLPARPAAASQAASSGSAEPLDAAHV